MPLTVGWDRLANAQRVVDNKHVCLLSGPEYQRAWYMARCTTFLVSFDGGTGNLWWPHLPVKSDIRGNSDS